MNNQDLEYDRSHTFDLDNKRVKSCTWPNGESIKADDTKRIELVYRIEFHGTWDDHWVAQFEDGKETRRWNVVYIDAIEWLWPCEKKGEK